jgi:acetate kinase
MERMNNDNTGRILTINSGSSSVKFSLYRMGHNEETLQFSGVISGIGQGGGRFHAWDADGAPLIDLRRDLAAHDGALKLFFEWFHSRPEGKELAAVGHRLVHGGRAHTRPHEITAELLTALDA